MVVTAVRPDRWFCFECKTSDLVTLQVRTLWEDEHDHWPLFRALEERVFCTGCATAPTNWCAAGRLVRPPEIIPRKDTHS